MKSLVLWSALFLVAAAACEDDRITVTDDTEADYGRGELLSAIATYGASGKRPEDYRLFAVRVAELSTQFDDAVAGLAERNLVFLALPPLEAAAELPMKDQYQQLALTVWPTFLGVHPHPDESPRQYTERVCGVERPLDCKRIAPDHHPVMLAGLVWGEVKKRARDALTNCRECRSETHYRDSLERIELLSARFELQAQRHAAEANPRRWPRAEPNARRWSSPPLFAIDEDGKASLAGDRVEAGRWREHLEVYRGRHGGDVLGVHLLPHDRVRTLRQIAADAAAVGYSELALQTRMPEYPYRLREYRIAIGKGARKHRHGVVAPREVDTVQILVQMLDAGLAAGAQPPLAI